MRFVESYTFTPGIRGAGTIVVPEVIELEAINRIWNVTKGALIYEATKSEYGIISIAVANGETTLTIETNTSTMDAADEIQILLYDGGGSSGGGGGSLGDGAIDAFGRQRVSEPLTIADYKVPYGIGGEFYVVQSGGGTAAPVTNEASIRLTVTTGATDYIYAQTRMYHQYQPGKSQLILFSFKLNGAEAGATKRVGLFDDRNGAFLEYDGATGDLSFVERRYVTGSPVDHPAAQSAWNVDRCDGTGPSGFDINVSTTQLLFIDYQWLGVGRVRMGFVHDGAYIVAHEIYHSNSLSTVYWSMPSLPLRGEIRNTSALAAPTTMDLICGSVQAEGGYTESGNDFAAFTSVRSIGNPPATLPVMAIKLKDAVNGYPNRMTVRLGEVNCYSETGGYRLDIYRLASHTQLTSTDVGGIVWNSANALSGVEYSTNLDGYTPAATDELIDSFFVVAGGGVSRPVSNGILNPSAARLTYIAQNYDSTDSMAFLLFATSLGNGADSAVTMQWRELQ